MSFTAELFCDSESTNNSFEGLFEHSIGEIVVEVDEPLITSEDIATLRAEAELIEGAYSTRVLNATIEYIPTLIQNDIISFNNLKWIVKEISTNYIPPKLTQTIKAVRYEW